MKINRRNFALSAAAAGAVFGLGGPVEFVGRASAQGAGASPLNPKGMKFHQFKVGDIEVTTVTDGAILRDHAAGFVKNASTDDIRAALRKGHLDDAKLPNSYTITVVKIGDRTIMFDSGNGPAGAAGTGELTANLKAAGIDTSKLSAIVVTHFHPDHIFGLMTKENAQLYPETEIIVPEAEFKFWADPGVVATLPESRRGIAVRVQSTMPGWKNLKQVADGKEAVDGVRAVASYGHTPGHTSYLVSSGSSQLFVLGDITNIPPMNMANPGWHLVVDQDAQVAEATRRRMFDRVVADRIVCAGYHWGMPGAGTISKDGSGYALTPVA